VLKTERMRGVSVDPGRRTARVEAGTVWDEVVEVAAQHGSAALAGSSPDVGVVGYTLGGGISFLGRRYGLAANHVRAIELVTADGCLVRDDREHEPDLFWALRGCGGSSTVRAQAGAQPATGEMHGADQCRGGTCLRALGGIGR
jgi:FAD/FMN-containing dehydrogenase